MGRLTKEYSDGRSERKAGGSIYGHAMTVPGSKRFVIVCKRDGDDEISYRLVLNEAEAHKLFKTLRNCFGEEDQP